MRWRTFLVAGMMAAAVAAVPAPAHADCQVPDAQYGPPHRSQPNPLIEEQWGLAQINVKAAWARGLRGQGVTVAVVDTGIDTTHPDLAPNLLPGADLLEKTDCPQDDTGHGTAVSGIIAAAADNRRGIAGVAPEARLIPLKVNYSGMTSIDEQAAIDGIRLAAARGAKVINISWGGLSHIAVFEETLQPAINEAWKAGAVIVASAGNAALPVCSSPGIKEHVICVAGSNREGRPSDTSQFPARFDESGVALRAPGGQFVAVYCEEWVLTTFDPRFDRNCEVQPGFGATQGTSLAAPHVAGVAALLAGAGLTNEDIVDRLRKRSSNNGSYDVVWGHGLVDADKATEGLTQQLRWPSSTTPAQAPGGQAGGAAPPAAQPGPAPATNACRSAQRSQARAQRELRGARRRLARSRSARSRRALRRQVAKRRAALQRAARRTARACGN